MSVPDLMADLYSAGVRLSVAASGLAWAAPPGIVTPDVLALLLRHKAGIVDFILWTRSPGLDSPAEKIRAEVPGQYIPTRPPTSPLAGGQK
ncbi:MAG: hypothetical protein AAB074_20105 [Planctomycetota bacterium]